MTRKQKRGALIASVVLFAGLAVGLVLVALRSAVAYFYTPADLIALAAPPAGVIRLGGLVAADSVKFGEGEDAAVEFTIEDGGGAVDVRFVGVLPDLFREGQGVVVQGRMVAPDRLEAIEVLAKHDETYMPKEVADALKAQGRWQEAE